MTPFGGRDKFGSNRAGAGQALFVDGNNRRQEGTPQLFRSQHRSVLMNPNSRDHFGKEGGKIMYTPNAQHHQSNTNGNLFRAQRPNQTQLFHSPTVSNKNQFQSRLGLGQTPPLYSQMAPKLSKTRPLMNPVKSSLNFDQTNFAHNMEEEQSTSKPQIVNTVVRNPSLQASLLKRDYRQTFEHNEGQMSFGKSNSTFNIKLPTKIDPGNANLFNNQGVLSRKTGQDQIVKIAGKTNFSVDDLKVATKAVQDKLDVQDGLSKDPMLNDIANQTINLSQGPQADYHPLTFLPTVQIDIPERIQLEYEQYHGENTVTEMSSRHNIIYYGIGNKLFVWDYKRAQASNQQKAHQRSHQQSNINQMASQSQQQVARNSEMLAEFPPFDTEITCIHELNCTNSKASWQLACDASQDCRHVIVATLRDIRLLLVKRDTNYGKLIVQETYLNALELPSASIIVEFQKNGRVFFGRQGGRVSELTFQNTEKDNQRNPNFLSTAQYTIMSHRKRLYHIEHQKDNILLRALPVLNFNAMQKQIIQLKIDEQRNILFSLGISEAGRCKGCSVVEIFDLGLFGNEFKHQTTMQMWEIAQAMDEFLGRKRDKEKNRYEWAAIFNITDIQPIQYSESKTVNLMLTTINCERIFIRLGTRLRQVVENAYQLKQLEQLGLQSDYLIEEEIVPGEWEIIQVLTQYPEESHVVGNEQLAQKLIQSPFGEHSLPGRKNRIQQSTKIPEMSYYDNSSSLLIFKTKEDDELRDNERHQKKFNDETNQSLLQLCFIQKNTGMFSVARQYAQEDQARQFEIRENFSLLQLARKDNDHQQRGQNFQLLNQRNVAFDEQQEQLLKVESMRSAEQSLSTLVTMGVLKLKKQRPTWGDSSHILPYMPCSELEQQVYLNGGKISILTDKRLVEIRQMRPIDKLYNLLVFMQESRFKNCQEDFLDFASLYTLEETCTMLVQICVDHQAHYQLSQRIDQLLNLKNATANQDKRMMMNQQNQLGGGSRFNMRSAGTMSLNRRAGGGPYQANQTRTFIGGRPSMNQSSMQHNQSHSANRIDPIKVFDEQNFSSLLNDFNPSLGAEVHTRQFTKSIFKLASDLLCQYGDSISLNQENFLSQCVRSGEGPNSHLNEASKLWLYSNKHKALYMYAYRILRPIWEMSITNYSSVTRLYEQQFNLDLMMPVREKLFDLFNFINQSERDLVGGHSNQNHDLIPPSCTLADGTILLIQLEQQLKEFVEVAERRSFSELKAFLRRCIDVIEFFIYIEQEVEKQKRRFSDLIRQLDPMLQDSLSNQKFQDFVIYKSDILVRKLLEKTINLEATGDAKLSEQTLRLKQEKVSELCPTLFSPQESRVFLGYSMLQQAAIEIDTKRQEELVSKAMNYLLIDPTHIDMSTVVPILAKLRQFQQIIHLALQKINPKIATSNSHRQHLSSEEKAEYIKDQLDLIVQIVDTLEVSILGEGKPVMDSTGFMNEFIQAIKKMPLEQKINMRDNIVAQLANNEQKEAIKHLLRSFLVKNREVDFICTKISSQIIQDQCALFVRQQSQLGLFTKKQFSNIYKVLSKARQVDELADIVRGVLRGQSMTLMQEQIGHRDAVDPDDQTELVICRLTCDERLSLTKKTIQLMDDTQRGGQNQFTGDQGISGYQNKTNGSNEYQITGVIGSRIELRMHIKQDLMLIQASLSAQADAIKSVKNKIALIERYLGRNSQMNTNNITKLQELLAQLDFDLLEKSDLQQLYRVHEIYDRYVQLLLENIPKTKDQAQSLQDQLQQSLVSMIIELKHFCEADNRLFEKEFKQQIQTVFTRKVIQTRLPLLFNIMDEVMDRVVYRVQDLALGRQMIWIQQLILNDLCVLPSQLLQHYLLSLKKHSSEKQLYFELCLAAIVQWSSILNQSSNQDLKKAFYEDLCAHGTSLYHQVIVNFCFKWIESHALQKLVRKDEDASLALYERANQDMIKMLLLNVQSFDQSSVVGIPKNKVGKQDSSKTEMQRSLKSSGPLVIKEAKNKTKSAQQVYKQINTMADQQQLDESLLRPNGQRTTQVMNRTLLPRDDLVGSQLLLDSDARSAVAENKPNSLH